MSCCCPPTDDSDVVLLQKVPKGHDADVDGRDSEACHGYQQILDSSENEKSNKLGSENKNTCHGYLFIFLGVITIVAALACAQALDHSVPHSELNGLIFTAQLILTTPILIGYKKCDVRVDRQMIGWMVLGMMLLTANTYGHYGAAYYLPLGVSSGITRSLVLVINYVLSCVINKVVKWYEFIAAILCISGVVMVTQPKFIFHDVVSSLINHSNTTQRSPCYVMKNIQSMNFSDTLYMDNNSRENVAESNGELLGYVICVVDALVTVSYMQLVKRKLSDLNIYIFNFWACSFAIVVSFCIMAGTETPFIPTKTLCITLLFINISCAGCHSIFDYLAYQRLDPLIAALILTLQIALTFILQYTVLSGIHPGHANGIGISGAVLIFLGNALVPACKLMQVFWIEKRNNIGTENNKDE